MSERGVFLSILTDVHSYLKGHVIFPGNQQCHPRSQLFRAVFSKAEYPPTNGAVQPGLIDSFFLFIFYHQEALLVVGTDRTTGFFFFSLLAGWLAGWFCLFFRDFPLHGKVGHYLCVMTK